MSVKINGVYQGKKRCQMSHQPSGATLTTDAPKDNQGEGSTFSPTDLLATALGSCVLTTMAIVADRDGVELAGSKVELEKVMSQNPRRVAEIPITIHLPQALPADYRAKIERVAHTCPVSKSLHPDVVVALTFSYDL